MPGPTNVIPAKNSKRTWPLPCRSSKRTAKGRASVVVAAGNEAEAREARILKSDAAPETRRRIEHEGVRDSINYYFSEMKRHRLLNYEEEKKLAVRIARGDKEARKRMIEANLRLVVNIARRYLNKGFALEDLIEEGNIGLIKAVERFRATKGCRFSTYATFWIKQTIERALSNHGNVVRLPIHITTDLAKVSRASKDLMMELHREPTSAEVSERTGFSGRYVKKLDIVGKRSFSLESSLPDNEELTLLDKIEDDKVPGPLESVEYLNRVARVGGLLGMLENNERKIVELRFGFAGGVPQTLEEIGTAFGVTRERVRQIESKALGKLREAVKDSDIASLEAI